MLIPIGGHFVKGQKYAVPMHDLTIPLLKGTPAGYLRALGKTDTKVFVMTPR